jgi:hypothetical protein
MHVLKITLANRNILLTYGVETIIVSVLKHNAATIAMKARFINNAAKIIRE